MTRTRRSASPWVMAGQIAWAAPQVVGYRTARILRAGLRPGPRDRREYVVMVREKVDTVLETAQELAGASPRSGSGLARALLGPTHRRVTANRKRLARG